MTVRELIQKLVQCDMGSIVYVDGLNAFTDESFNPARSVLREPRYTIISASNNTKVKEKL